jgi:hypothetical protein
MTPNAQVHRLYQRFQEAGTAQDVRAVLEEIANLEQGGLRDENLDMLRAQAFRALLRLTEMNLDDARTVVLTGVLPLCLRSEADWEGKGAGWRYTALLREWINTLSSRDRATVRGEITRRLLAALEEGPVESACETVGELGYRTRELTSALQAVASRDPLVGDVALWARMSLGAGGDDRVALREQVHARMPQSWTQPLIGALSAIADRTSLDPLFNYWLTPEKLVAPPEGDLRYLSLFALQIPGRIAERSPDDAGLQDEVWERIRRLRDSARELVDSRLFMGDELAHPCDTPDVVATLLSLVQPGQTPNLRLLLYLRLQEFVRPRQLSGWGMPLSTEVSDLVLHDFLTATGMVGRSRTLQADVKQAALDLLVSAGNQTALTLLDSALRVEQSGYLIARVLDLAACFRIDPLPGIVLDLLANRDTHIPEADNQRFVAHISAIHVAHACESPEAFQALLQFEQPGQGDGVLLSLVDALADTASTLIASGDQSVAEQLWQALDPGSPAHRRIAATAAIASLLRRQCLPDPSYDRVWQVVQDHTLNPFARKELLDALGDVPRGSLPPRILDNLRTSLVTLSDAGTIPPEMRGEWQNVVLGVLACHGRLAQDHMLMTDLLGLSRRGHGWDLAPPEQSKQPSPHVLGILYAEDPASFAPAVADLLQKGATPTIAQILPYLDQTGIGTPPDVVDALARRIGAAQTGQSGNLGLLGVLARICPDRLALEAWPNFQNWLPQVRAGFANALGFAPIERADARHHRLDLLLKLMGDGQYGVRRAAYRAMATAEPQVLASLCTSWAGNVDVAELRQRAAEAAQWAPDLGGLSEVQVLAADPEPTVRETWTRCAQERQERLWARQYLGRLQAVWSEECILPAWCSGRALERVGDDEAEEGLQALAQERDRPAGVRYWLRRVANKVGERWRKVTEQWPEPWFSCRGNLEEVEGEWAGRQGAGGPFHGWLWLVPASTPTGQSSWGGWAEQAFPGTDQIELKIQGRPPARALVARTVLPSGPSYLVGTGPYPDPATQATTSGKSI